VNKKLYEYGIFGEDKDEIIISLISDDYLNEERFARSFARGRFRMKSWGKMKITQKLKEKGVSKFCIEKGLTEIDEEEYREKLTQVIEKKWRILKHNGTIFTKKQKVATFVKSKGYENALIWELLNSHVQNL